VSEALLNPRTTAPYVTDTVPLAGAPGAVGRRFAAMRTT
jgi:hypothetical protein